MIQFKKTGIPEKLKDSILARANLESTSKNLFLRLNEKIEEWFNQNFEQINQDIVNLNKNKFAHIADKKSLNKWWGNENIEIVSINRNNIDILCYYGVRMSWIDYSSQLNESEKNLYTGNTQNRKISENDISTDNENDIDVLDKKGTLRKIIITSAILVIFIVTAYIIWINNDKKITIKNIHAPIKIIDSKKGDDIIPVVTKSTDKNDSRGKNNTDEGIQINGNVGTIINNSSKFTINNFNKNDSLSKKQKK